MKAICRGATLTALAAGILLAAGGAAAASSNATGAAFGSPGVLSGNVVQIPIDVPVNACGNSINLLGILNPSFGNVCANVSSHKSSRHEKAGKEHKNSHAEAGTLSNTRGTHPGNRK
ncbi:chaplin [Actinacidiphila paucisporea]|uniref:Small secreted domain n=1 Tax=Actinacidiphila paucisporea TaxID=310782 RepID=A0A1M7H9U7_9ACTN|nr:chaplin [Actinacidiphila paucisporea]SHM24957.1 Small secreted domain [Actinacidiphila paucisporea]